MGAIGSRDKLLFESLYLQHSHLVRHASRPSASLRSSRYVPVPKPKLLVLSFFPCFYPPKSGGELRLFHLYRNLTESFEITMLSSAHVGDPVRRIVHAPSFVEYRIGKGDAYLSSQAIVDTLAGHGDKSAVTVGLSGLRANDLHTAYFEHYDEADIIIHESPYTALYDVMLGLDDKPRVYNSYNAEYKLIEALHPDPKSKPIRDFVRSSELALVGASDLVTYCAEQDRVDLELLLGNPLINGVLIPNGTERLPIREPVMEQQRTPKMRRVVFVGSRHAPNVEAANFLVNEVADAAPNLEFHIVGPCLPAGRPRNNVICHGLVSDQEKAHILEASDIAVNPMVSGSGSNLKAIEYMALGFPIVATQFGMRGTFAEPGRHYMMADLTNFTQTIQDLAEDSELRTRLGTEARSLAHNRLSWPKIAHQLGEALMALHPTEPQVSALEAELGEKAKVQPDDGKFILCLNDYDPVTSVGGGVTRMLGLHRALAVNDQVVLLCLHSGTQIERVPMGPNYTVIKIPQTAEHRARAAEMDAKFHVSSADIVAYLEAPHNSLLVSTYAALRKRSKLVVLEHPYMASLVARSNDPFIYSSQNDELALKTGMLRGHPSYEELIAAVRDAEDTCLRQARMVVAVSDNDAKAFSQRIKHSSGPIIVVPNGAESAVEPTTAAAERVGPIAPRSVVFVGSAHMPNIEASWYIRDVIAQALPDIEFHLIGSVGDAIGQDLPSNIRVWGVVDADIKSAIMNKVAVAINPVVSGGGSNVKLSDYFAHGLPTVTSAFGLRGYPEVTGSFVQAVDLGDFPSAISDMLRKFPSQGPHRSDIKAVFDRHLSMKGHAAGYAKALQSLLEPRKRILLVTYRYSEPPLGGAETMMLQLLRELDASGEFVIDIVCPEVGLIANSGRFGCNFSGVDDLRTPIGLSATRWRRFSTQTVSDVSSQKDLARAWRVQMDFDQILANKNSNELATSQATRLLAGWHAVEHDAHGNTKRWTSSHATFELGIPGTLRLKGWSPRPKELRVNLAGLRHSASVDGEFDLRFAADAGLGELEVEGDQHFGDDMRVLGVYLSELRLGDQNMLREATASELVPLNPELTYSNLYDAARATRWPADIDLTDLRGPHSREMSQWLDDNISDYDLVLTHNCVFRPAVEVLKLAKARKVPSVFVPHIHLDDDFYHFRDITAALEDATVSLVSPASACEFLRQRVSSSIRYFGAGADEGEFNQDGASADIEAFRQRYSDDLSPFMLVLGRKAGAKNYFEAIRARQILAEMGYPTKVVMIGPDEDGLPIDDPDVVFLGRQPRNVVRGALREAVVLVNMSTSESFGIVLLEAWLAGTPVIANSDCPAFGDLVTDRENGFLVADAQGIAESVRALVCDPSGAVDMASRGREVASRFSWRSLGNELKEICNALIESNREAHALQR